MRDACCCTAPPLSCSHGQCTSFSQSQRGHPGVFAWMSNSPALVKAAFIDSVGLQAWIFGILVGWTRRVLEDSISQQCETALSHTATLAASVTRSYNTCFVCSPLVGRSCDIEMASSFQGPDANGSDVRMLAWCRRPPASAGASTRQLARVQLAARLSNLGADKHDMTVNESLEVI